MASITSIRVADKDPVAALQGFLASLLENGVADAVFTMRQRPGESAVMPALITDPAKMTQANPLCPAYPLSGARLLSRLTHGESQGTIAAVLRPCELRAFVELIKLNQASQEGLLLIAVDCFGAMSNATWRAAAADADPKDLANRFTLSGGTLEGFPVARACLACEHPTAPNADLAIGLVGVDAGEGILIVSQTAAGENAINLLDLKDAPGGEAREQALADLVAKREAYRDTMFAETAESTKDLSGLAAHLSGCVNCYNCRVACPVSIRRL